MLTSILKNYIEDCCAMYEYSILSYPGYPSCKTSVASAERGGSIPGDSEAVERSGQARDAAERALEARDGAPAARDERVRADARLPGGPRWLAQRMCLARRVFELFS